REENSEESRVGGALGPLGPRARARRAFDIKEDNAEFQRNKPIPRHTNNGDEANLPGFVGNFHKGLPVINPPFGEVDPQAYRIMLNALRSGQFTDFEKIPLGGTNLLTNPQSGLAFDTEGTDSHQFFIRPSPATASAERAAEAVENY